MFSSLRARRQTESGLLLTLGMPRKPPAVEPSADAALAMHELDLEVLWEAEHCPLLTIAQALWSGGILSDTDEPIRLHPRAWYGPAQLGPPLIFMKRACPMTINPTVLRYPRWAALLPRPRLRNLSTTEEPKLPTT